MKIAEGGQPPRPPPRLAAPTLKWKDNTVISLIQTSRKRILDRIDDLDERAVTFKRRLRAVVEERLPWKERERLAEEAEDYQSERGRLWSYLADLGPAALEESRLEGYSEEPVPVDHFLEVVTQRDAPENPIEEDDITNHRFKRQVRSEFLEREEGGAVPTGVGEDEEPFHRAQPLQPWESPW